MEAEKMKESDMQWCINTHNMISLWGTWAVPRSGLIFQKTPTGFKLIEVMPFTPEMGEAWKKGQDVPENQERLKEYQRFDFKCISRYFNAVNLQIVDDRNLLA